MGKRFKEEAVLVIGLGRFGGAVAEELHKLGQEVLAIDEREAQVEFWSTQLPHVMQLDATNHAALRQIGAHEFKLAIVAIGTGIEASVLTTAALADIGVPEVWSKAITHAHGKILERIGAGHVIYPERDAGIRVARALSSELIDYTEVEDGFAMAKIRAPKRFHGQTLKDLGIRENFGVNVVGLKSPGSDFTASINRDTQIQSGDLLVVAGATAAVEGLTKLDH